MRCETGFEPATACLEGRPPRLSRKGHFSCLIVILTYPRAGYWVTTIVFSSRTILSNFIELVKDRMCFQLTFAHRRLGARMAFGMCILYLL